MSEIICPCCRGEGELEYTCQNCSGTGMDPTEDNAFGQCHFCYGEGDAKQPCFKCHGVGWLDEDDLGEEDEEDEDEDEDEEDEDEDEDEDYR